MTYVRRKEGKHISSKFLLPLVLLSRKEIPAQLSSVTPNHPACIYQHTKRRASSREENANKKQLLTHNTAI